MDFAEHLFKPCAVFASYRGGSGMDLYKSIARRCCQLNRGGGRYDAVCFGEVWGLLVQESDEYFGISDSYFRVTLHFAETAIVVTSLYSVEDNVRSPRPI